MEIMLLFTQKFPFVLSSNCINLILTKNHISEKIESAFIF